jgi:hypothetical protein
MRMRGLEPPWGSQPDDGDVGEWCRVAFLQRNAPRTRTTKRRRWGRSRTVPVNVDLLGDESSHASRLPSP